MFGGISSLLIIENLQPLHIPLGLSVSSTPQILQIILLYDRSYNIRNFSRIFKIPLYNIPMAKNVVGE